MYECNGNNGGSREQLLVQSPISTKIETTRHLEEFKTPQISKSISMPISLTSNTLITSVPLSTMSSNISDDDGCLTGIGEGGGGCSAGESGVIRNRKDEGCILNKPTSLPSPSESQEPPLKQEQQQTCPLPNQEQGNRPKEKSLIQDFINIPDLLDWKDMPQYLQFNPYVLTGYRPLQNIRGCMSSLFYWHNETINILTHAIPIIYILATVPGIIPWEKDFRFLSFCHLFGAVAPWCGSFIYHLFMNLEKGEVFYYRLLKIDMLGIWVSQSFGAVPMVTACMFCFDVKLKSVIIFSYCVMCLYGLYKAMTASSPWQRRLCFSVPFTMRAILICLRTFRLVGGNPAAIAHVYLQDVVSVLGGAIGAMHIPEKWFPGSVDLYFNSHNIMHILVVSAVYSMHQATVSDFEWMSRTTCNAVNSSEATIDMATNSHTDL